MSTFFARILIVAASVTHASASCAYGTHLSPRAEEGAPIKVNTFGYTGVIVRYSRPPLTYLTRLCLAILWLHPQIKKYRC